MTHYQLDIPDDEFQKFKPFINIYSKGKVIVHEGDTHDHRIFLLRQGKVEILRWVGERQQTLSMIEAVNFFGEMAVVTSRPRTASVVAVSDPVVVYAFEKSNLQAILTNYKWSTLLLKRVTDNLEQMNEEFKQHQILIDKIHEGSENFLGMLISLHETAKRDPVLQKRYFEMLPKLVNLYMKDTNSQAVPPDNFRLDQYRRRGIIPEQLYLAAIMPLINEDEPQKPFLQ